MLKTTMSTTLQLVVVCCLFSAPGQCQTKSADDGNPVPVGYWEGTIRPKKEIPLIPADGILAKLEFENSNGSLTGTLDAASQKGKIRKLNFDPKSGILTGNVSIAAFAFEIELEFKEDVFKGWLNLGEMKVAIDGERTRKPSLDLTVYSTSMWIEDIQFLARELPRRHHSFYRGFDESTWESACEELIQRVPKLEVNDIPFWINHLIGMKGDDHTRLATHHLPAYRSAPIGLRFFEDGIFVTSVPEQFKSAMGCRLTKIGSLEIKKVLELMDGLFETENESWKKYIFAQHLANPRILKNTGALSDANDLRIEIESPHTGQVTRLSVSVDHQVTSWVTRVSEIEPEKYPLYEVNARKNYWGRYLEKDAAVYVAYNRCREDSAKPFHKFVSSLATIIEKKSPERVIIDLRKNSGGSSPIIAPLIELLNKNRQFANSGKLFVLIGRRTFSSAMMNSHELRNQCDAVLVGEPTGGKPNHYGEVMPFELPNSRLAVWRSTKYFRHVEDDPPSVMPKHVVTEVSKDYFECRDAALEFALNLNR